MWAILISAVYLLYIYTVYRGRPWASLPTISFHERGGNRSISASSRYLCSTLSFFSFFLFLLSLFLFLCLRLLLLSLFFSFFFFSEEHAAGGIEHGPPQAKAPQGIWGSGGLPPVSHILGQVPPQSQRKVFPAVKPTTHIYKKNNTVEVLLHENRHWRHRHLLRYGCAQSVSHYPPSSSR